VRVPSLTAVSILTIALGVGAGTALFSVVKAVMLNPLPYPDPARIAWVAEVNSKGRGTQVAYANYADWHGQNHSFGPMAAFYWDTGILTGGVSSETVHTSFVTEDFFRVMGVQPAVGRAFSDEEHKSGGPGVALLGNGLWQRAFGSDPSVIGRTVRLRGRALTVVGIMPRGFDFPHKADIWMPLEMVGDPGYTIRTGHNYRVAARLKPGVSMESASADVDAIERHIAEQYPSPFQFQHASAVTLQSHIEGPVRQPLLMLFSAVGFVLLIVCVNVANLLLVRVTARSREFAIRTAIGAARRHLVRQMLAESLLLALGGGACGVLLAFWSMDLLRVMLPADMPRAGDIGIDAGVIGFALAVSAAAGLLFGLLPAWRASAMNVNDTLKSGSRSATSGRRTQRTQSALVVSEVCLSLVLVAGAGLLARSFWNLRSVQPGFQADHVLTANTALESERKTSLVPRYRDLLARVRALPGVQSAAIVGDLPIGGGGSDGHFFIEGRQAETANADAIYNVITPGYFQSMRIPILRGRDITERDTESSTPVAVISAEMARVYFPGSDPIGRRVLFDSFGWKDWLTIVGVAGEVRQSGITQPVEPQVYTCYTQQPIPGLLNSGALVLRTAVDPMTLAAPVRTIVREITPGALPEPRTMETVLAVSLARQRFQMQVLGGFALLALVLAAVGLYGVLSYMVTANSADIGIRLALGAQRSVVFRAITGRALSLAGFGVVIGAVGCLAVRRVLTTFVFGIGPNDPATIVGAVAVLLVVTLAAAWFPARRATKVDPMIALRDE